jgi:hypothetical protein
VAVVGGGGVVLVACPAAPRGAGRGPRETLLVAAGGDRAERSDAWPVLQQ